MSGIVGIFERKGAPVNRPLLQSLVDFLSSRGPNARETWADGPVAFGHTLLRTTDESLAECQPASLDRQFWITADTRIDCRAELIAELDSKGHTLNQTAPDSEMILHAYAAWGEACVHHLRGDFAFVPSAPPTDNAFAFAIGGGLDASVMPHIAIRVGEFDYEQTRNFNGGTTGNPNQNNYKFKAGVIVRF